MLYKGKPLDEYTKEDLIKVCEELHYCLRKEQEYHKSTLDLFKTAFNIKGML